MNTQVQTLALTLANGLAVQLITLAVAMIGLTVTFAKDFQQNKLMSQLILLAIWLAFLIGILSGIFCIKALISIITPQKPTDALIVITDDALHWATWQEYLFYAGLVLFIIQGAISIVSVRKKREE